MDQSDHVTKLPKCELPVVIIRHNIGPVSAANIRLLLLGQCRRLHRSSAGPTTVAFVDCSNLPTFSRNLAQYRPYIKPIVTYYTYYYYIAGPCVNFPRQTILKVKKPDVGTALARCCAENKCWCPKFGPELAAKCIPELSFQQRHNIGNRSLEKFWRCWANVGPYLTSHLGIHLFVHVR